MSPSGTATVACVSIGLCVSVAIPYVTSIVTGAPAKARVGIAALAGDVGRVGLEVVIDVGRFRPCRSRRQRRQPPSPARTCRPPLAPRTGPSSARRRRRAAAAARPCSTVVKSGVMGDILPRSPLLEYGAHPRHLPRARGIDRLNGATCNGCPDRHGIEHPWETMVGGVLRRPRHLERSVDAGPCLADNGHRPAAAAQS